MIQPHPSASVESKRRDTILIVHEGKDVRTDLSEFLKDWSTCLTAASAEEAIWLLREQRPAVLITGLDLMEPAKQTSPDTVIVMITEERPLDDPTHAMRTGIFDFITKPFERGQIVFALRRAVEHHGLLVSKRRLDDIVKGRTEQLKATAFNDVLTGLPNRSLLIDRLTRALSNSDGGAVAVLVITPERFRDVRNTLGQEMADRLLKEFADRLRGISSPDTILARSDTDELTAALPQIAATRDVDTFVEGIVEALKAPFTAGGRKIFLTASIGISVYPQDGSDAHTILRNAGAALTHARRHGTRCEYFDQSMQDAAMRRLLIENDLRHALARGELAVHYQPKIANLTGRITGFEALARWHHPAGEIEPSEFIPVAEATGSILELGEWVLNEACLQAARWHRGGRDLTIAVNVSAAQFDADLVDVVEHALSHSGIDPTRLELEVTESSLMTSASDAVELIRELKKTGLKIAIDDFGTGYSSLGQLRRLPIDVLKIDRSFVADVTSNADDASLIMGIVSLAHNLNLKVVAEGVESAEQLRFLKLLKCDEWQGFLASRAVPAEAAERMLAGNINFCN